MIAASKMDKFSDILGESPIDIKIGLFCMENFSYSYMKKLLEENNVDINDVKECRIEKNSLWFYLKEDKIFKIPIEKAKSCARKNCNICMDFTSELSDFSVGSVGSQEGWSTIIIRTDKGFELVKNAENDKYIQTKPIEESGLKLIKNLANKKKKENLSEITKREMSRQTCYLQKTNANHRIHRRSFKMSVQRPQKVMLSILVHVYSAEHVILFVQRE